MRYTRWIPLLLAVGCAFNELPAEVRPPVADTDTPPLPDLETDGVDEPTGVRITAPTEGARVGASFQLTARIVVPGGVAALCVRRATDACAPVEATADLRRTLSAPPGPFSVAVIARDGADRRYEASVNLIGPTVPDGGPPALRIIEPEPSAIVFGTEVLMRGEAEDDGAVRAVTIEGGAVPPAQPLAAVGDDDFARFSAVVPLVPGAAATLRVRAVDDAGNETVREVRVVSRASAVGRAPAVRIAAPRDGAEIDADAAAISGTVSDDGSITGVEAAADGGEAVRAAFDAAGGAFNVTLPLEPGPHRIKVRAYDDAGNEGTAEIAVNMRPSVRFGPALVVTLRRPVRAAGLFTLELDRRGLNELLTEDTRRSIEVLRIDPGPLVANALAAVRDACGAGWPGAGFSDRGCPVDWTQRERNMWRLVTATTDNINLNGTSVQGMAELASTLSSLGVIEPIGEILRRTLGLSSRRDPIVDLDNMAAAITENAVRTHPAVPADGTLPITLDDALLNLAPLGARYGPAGGHPGFMDPAVPPRSDVLGPDFAMRVVAESNLVRHEGVILGAGKEFMTIIAPGAEDVLAFDFIDPARFSVRGIADDPRVDLSFVLVEHPGWVAAGTAPDPLPRGNGVAWSGAVAKSTIEYVIADAAYRKYATLRTGCDLCRGRNDGALLYELPVLGTDEAEIVVGRAGYDDDPLIGQPDGRPEHFPIISPNPAGWLRTWTLFGLGSPPRPQYVWDMIGEIAQRRLQDGGVTEGTGSVRFVLTGVRVGLSGARIAELLRPALERQKAELSRRMLGDYARENAALDFFVIEPGGTPALAFPGPDDPLPPGAAPATDAGFFDDAARTRRASVRDADGRERIAVADLADRTVYARGRDGGTYAVRLVDTDGDTVRLAVRRREDGGP